MENRKTKFPASHKIAIVKKSFIQERGLVQRCRTQLCDIEREVITHAHWKPISKIIT